MAVNPTSSHADVNIWRTEDTVDYSDLSDYFRGVAAKQSSDSNYGLADESYGTAQRYARLGKDTIRLVNLLMERAQMHEQQDSMGSALKDARVAYQTLGILTLHQSLRFKTKRKLKRYSQECAARQADYPTRSALDVQVETNHRAGQWLQPLADF